jgi:hypothetical protein
MKVKKIFEKVLNEDYFTNAIQKAEQLVDMYQSGLSKIKDEKRKKEVQKMIDGGKKHIEFLKQKQKEDKE